MKEKEELVVTSLSNSQLEKIRQGVLEYELVDFGDPGKGIQETKKYEIKRGISSLLSERAGTLTGITFKR